MNAWAGSHQLKQKTLAAAFLTLVALAAGMAAPHDLIRSTHEHTSILTVHLLMELFSIIIAMLVIVISWNAFDARPSQSANILVCGFVIVASCDIFHTLTYEGMPALLAPSSTPRAIFFWLMGRTFEVGTMALLAIEAAPALSRRFWLGTGCAIATVLVWFGSYQINDFPVTFIKGQGVTPFKADYEYLLCLLNVVVAAIFWRRALASGEVRDYLLSLSSFVMGVGEVMFTAYVQPSDFQNIYGHTFKLVAYALLFRATFVTSIRAPFETIRESESRLHDSEERWKFALEGSGDGVWDVNLQTGKALYSKRYQEMLEYAEGEFHGSYSEWFDHIHPEDRPGVMTVLQAHLDRKSMIYTVENRMRCKNGHYIWVCSRGMVVSHTPDGKPLRMIGTHTDITQRKVVEEELQQHRLHLERLVAERTADLSVAKARADAANNAKSRFLAAASHDLRQPLSALSLYGGLLKGHVMPAGQPMLVNMKDCIGSLSELLTDLLDLSKLDAGVVAPNLSDFQIAEVLEYLASVHGPEGAVRGLRLRWVPTTLTAHTDPVLFKRLLGNLMANAVRYTNRGGVLVACRRRLGKTWVEVWDTGIGIPADKTVEIFDEFKQLDGGARNRGSGLGLAIVAKTATLLGLEIRVRSQPGRGSLFAVELPLGQPAPAMSTPAQRAVVSRSLRIALVDDNPIVRGALAEGLQALGHQAVAAASKATLLAELGTLPPDIVVSDYRLTQGETGFDVITAVRARLGAELPAILITGDTDPKLLRSMTERGIIVLHKPLELETLQTCFENLIDQATKRLPPEGSL